MPAFIGDGDDGYTGLLGNERVAKHHIRPHCYGTVDEASAALGLARSLAQSEETKTVIRAIRKDLYHLMAELAAAPGVASRFREIDGRRVGWLEAELHRFEKMVDVPRDFVLSDDAPAAAALDLARTVVRRAERLVAQLHHDETLENPHILAYLNRLSSMCFILVLWEHHLASGDAPHLAKEDQP